MTVYDYQAKMPYRSFVKNIFPKKYTKYHQLHILDSGKFLASDKEAY